MRDCISKRKIYLIILSAGKSERFLAGNKLLYEVNGEALIHRIVRTALESEADEVLLVTGHQSREIEDAINDLREKRLKVIFNPNYQEGMSSSVKLGIEHVKDFGEAAIIHPADVAFISKEVINHLIDIYKKNRPKIAVVSYDKRAGHPILFHKTMFDEILGITEEEMGLKSVVRRHKNEVLYIPVDEEEVLIDVDTIDDIKRYMDSKRK